MTALRARVAEIASSQIGVTDPSKYWLDVLRPRNGHPTDGKGKPLAWCGAFALWCLHQAGLAVEWNWEVGRGFLYRLKRTQEPELGDVAYKNEPYQHHAIVVGVSGDTVATVDGNKGGKVATQTQGRGYWSAFYSIGELVEPRAEEWKRLQRRLRDLGYYSGKIDADVGPKTRAAILRLVDDMPERVTIC